VYRIAFSAGLLGAVAAWLMLNRDGLTVLLRPETGHDLRDHGVHAVWFGPSRCCGLRLSNNRAKQFEGATGQSLAEMNKTELI
jgi:aromatic ring-cleaving dioxygenase